MKFSFKKYFKLLLIIDFAFIVLVLLLFGFGMGTLVFIISVLGIDIWKQFSKKNELMKMYSAEEKEKIEEDLNKAIWVHDEWYFTEEYIYSIDSFKKVYYKDILVVEGGPTLYGYSSAGANSVGWKQKLYLENGETYKISFQFDEDYKLEKFKKLLLEKNKNIFFGIIEDYHKNQNKKESEEIK